MTRSIPKLFFCALLGLATAAPAVAQLKAPGQSSSGLGLPSGRAPAPAAPDRGAPAPAATPSGPKASNVEAKETAGRIAAAGWLTLLDRRDWGTAWETSSAAFRKSVPLAKWMDGAPQARANLGALQERSPANVAYKTRIEGLPPGEYVTAIFVSKFAQRELEEVVTTVREPDGHWRVTGYSPR